MSDVVVTVPKTFQYGQRTGLAAWIDEGDLPGQPWSGFESHFYLGGHPPHIAKGERVYVVCEGKLRGYAPLVRIDRISNGFAFVRRGDAVAVTLADPIQGFQSFRYRWWEYEDEIPFPDWKTV